MEVKLNTLGLEILQKKDIEHQTMLRYYGLSEDDIKKYGHYYSTKFAPKENGMSTFEIWEFKDIFNEILSKNPDVKPFSGDLVISKKEMKDFMQLSSPEKKLKRTR